MTTAEKLAALESAQAAVLKVIEDIDLLWGEYDDRLKTPKAMVSLADARNFLERAGKKLSVSARHLQKEAKS